MFNVCQGNGGSGEGCNGGGGSVRELAMQGRHDFNCDSAWESIPGKYIFSRNMDLVLVTPRCVS